MRHITRKTALQFFLFSLLFLPFFAHAAPSFFEPVQGDKSIETILAPIFGELFGGSASPFAAVMKIFNAACLTVGAMLSAYTLVAGTMNTAHEGEILGKKWSSAWVPIRTTLGMSLCAPLPSGYCVAQLLVAWAISQGVGLADNVWSTYTQTSINQSNMAPMTTLPNVQTLVSSILQSQVCMAAYNKVVQDLGESVQMAATGASNGGRQYGGAGKSPDACGSVSFSIKEVSDAKQGDAANSVYGSNIGQTSAAAVQQAHIQATAQIEGTLAPLAKALVDYRDSNGGSAPSLAPITEAIQQYQQQVSQAAKSSVAGEDALKQITESATKNGWLFAGAWFMKAAQLQDSVNKVVANVPTARPLRQSEFSSLTGDMRSYMNTANAVLSKANNGLSDKDLDAITGAGNSSNPFYKAFASFTNNTAGGLLAVASVDKNRHPLMAIKDFGDHVMVASEAAIAGGTLIKVAASAAKSESDSWLGQAANLGTLGTTSAMAGGLGEGAHITGNIIIALGFVMLMFGGSIAVVLPMMPFLRTFGAVIGWLVMCGEAIIAAPLWAVSHNRPHGDGIAGAASQGYMLILGLLLRPAFIILGFILSTLAVQALVPIFNDLFFVAFRTASAGSITGVVTILIMLGIYTGAVLSIINQCFKLVHEVPDKVLKWIGGGIEQLGQMADKMMNESRNTGVAVIGNISTQAQTLARQGGGGAMARAGASPGIKDSAGVKTEGRDTTAKPASYPLMPASKAEPDKPKE